MQVLTWIVFGALVGWIASLVMKTDNEQGAIANIIIGILGAVIGGAAWSFLTGDQADSLIGQLVLAVLGAMAVIGLWRAVRTRSTV